MKRGLAYQAKLGTNPFKFGMVGSTDSHTSLSTTSEDNFFGKHSGKEPKPDRWEKLVGQFGDTKFYGWEQVSSGYAAVWATENTREALFDAIRERLEDADLDVSAVYLVGGHHRVQAARTEPSSAARLKSRSRNR